MDNNNTGKQNTGDRNTGNRNTGDLNTGNRNTGYRNTGDRNTGNRNTGNRNTGYRNTGDRNTGNRNTGNRNTGNRNPGNRNTGYLNTISPRQWLLFNKLVNLWDDNWNLLIEIPNYFYFSVNTTDRIDRDSMTEEEQKKHPWANAIWWFLRVYEVSKNLHKEWRESFDKAAKEDVAKTLDLPWFDYTIFEEITGITKEDFDKKLWETMTWKVVKVTIEGKEYNAVIH